MAVVFGDLGIDQFPAKSILTGESPYLVCRHETAVTDHVGGKNGGKPAFQALSPSPRRLTTMNGRIYADEQGLECLFLATKRHSGHVAGTSAFGGKADN